MYIIFFKLFKSFEIDSIFSKNGDISLNIAFIKEFNLETISIVKFVYFNL